MSQQAAFEALADNLSASANALHGQLMRAIRNGAPREQAQELFDQEIALRTQADSLYLDAAKLAASGLGDAQQQLVELTGQATAAIAKIEHIKDLLDIAANLLQLGAGIASGKPEQVLKPLENLKHQIEDLRS
jgi:hypothetical protein